MTPQSKKNTIIICAIVGAILIIGGISALFSLKGADEKPAAKAKKEAQPQMQMQILTGEQADSMMRAHAAQFAEADSMMNAMMEEMMSGDSFAEMDRQMAEAMGSMQDAHAHQMPQQEQPQTRQRKTSKSQIFLAGNLGNEQIILTLNAKDPQNISGTAQMVENGKVKQKMHVLGIGNGRDLTVTTYDAKNNAIGTLSGTYDGNTYRGIYTSEDKEMQFFMQAQ